MSSVLLGLRHTLASKWNERRCEKTAMWAILWGSAAWVSQLHGVIPGGRLRNSLKILQSHVNKKQRHVSSEQESLINDFFPFLQHSADDWKSINESSVMELRGCILYIVCAQYPHIWHTRPIFALDCHPVKPYASTPQHPTHGYSPNSTKKWDAPKTTFWSRSSCFSMWAEV